MKEFDYKLAINNNPIITRNGKSARLICHDRVDKKYGGNLVVLINNNDNTWERIVTYNKYGKTVGSRDPDLDLFMKDA